MRTVQGLCHYLAGESCILLWEPAHQCRRSHQSLSLAMTTIQTATRKAPISTRRAPRFRGSFSYYRYHTSQTHIQPAHLPFQKLQQVDLHIFFRPSKYQPTPIKMVIDEKAITTTVVACPHEYSMIKSDCSILLWNCQFCASGAHWAIFQCRICHIKADEPCTKAYHLGTGKLNTVKWPKLDKPEDPKGPEGSEGPGGSKRPGDSKGPEESKKRK